MALKKTKKSAPKAAPRASKTPRSKKAPAKKQPKASKPAKAAPKRPAAKSSSKKKATRRPVKKATRRPVKKATARVASPKAPPAAPARAQQPALPGWVADHIDRYLATNGADGHVWRGVTTLLLTTEGRRSGEPRLLPLIYGSDRGRYVVVASRGGAPDHPSWYRNLVENPRVQLQVGARRFRGIARTANRDERPRLWRLMTGIWPAYDQYQSRTAREIPVVVIEPVAGS